MALERVKEMLDQVAGTARVETAYGESREVAGKTIIPVARVSYGGGGGGQGRQGEAEQGQEGVGGGGGLGVNVQPLGCFIVTKESERWVPVVDVTRVAVAGSMVAVMLLWTIRKIAGSRRED
ncbi:MAG: sporulation protein [Armatimonadota bacterium]|nr:MAG: sporulation protein [Armatimonadota bacterium]